MPRENIDVESRWRVTVGWSRNQDVQLATLNQAFPEGEVEAGWFVTLTRAEINRLIRVLRNARDGAYGADA